MCTQNYKETLQEESNLGFAGLYAVFCLSYKQKINCTT